jgi:hypothetical protein
MYVKYSKVPSQNVEEKVEKGESVFAIDYVAEYGLGTHGIEAEAYFSVTDCPVLSRLPNVVDIVYHS